MAKQRTAKQEEFFAKVEEAKAKTTKVVDNFNENDFRDTRIKRMSAQFNVNQIASMLMIPKEVVEEVLSQK